MGWSPLLLAALLALVVAACGPGPTAASPTAGDQKVRITDSTKRELEAVFERKAAAMARGDLPGFQRMIDTTRGAFRRCQEETFQIAQRRGAPAAPTIVKVEPYLETYVRAYVGGRDGVERTYFRRVDDRWVQTEPRSDELGGEKKKTVDSLDVAYWGVDEDIVDLLATEGVATRDFLLKLARGPTRVPFAVKFFPTRERAGLIDCGVVGTHFTNDPKDPFLRIYRVWLTPDLKQSSDFMQGVFKHEGLHWLQDQFVAGISARLDWWLGEGWPDFVGRVPRSGTIVCRSAPTMKQLIDGPKEDPTTPPEVSAAFYDYAHLMVEYLYEKYGQDAYWDLMTAFKESVVAKDTYEKVLQTTPDRFYADWLVWAKKKFC